MASRVFVTSLGRSSLRMKSASSSYMEQMTARQHIRQLTTCEQKYQFVINKLIDYKLITTHLCAFSVFHSKCQNCTLSRANRPHFMYFTHYLKTVKFICLINNLGIKIKRMLRCIYKNVERGPRPSHAHPLLTSFMIVKNDVFFTIRLSAAK